MRELIAQAEALEEFAAQIDVAPDAVTPRLLSIALKQTAATYRAAAQPPAAQPVAWFQTHNGVYMHISPDAAGEEGTFPLYAHPDPRIAKLEGLLREALIFLPPIAKKLIERIAAALKEGA